MTNKKAAVKPAKEPKAPKVPKEKVVEPTSFPETTVAEAIAAGKFGTPGQTPKELASPDSIMGEMANVIPPDTGGFKQIIPGDQVPPPREPEIKKENKKKTHKKSGDDVPEFKDLVTYIPENGADPIDAVVLDVHNDNTVSLLFEDKSEKRIVQKGNKPGHWHYKE